MKPASLSLHNIMPYHAPASVFQHAAMCVRAAQCATFYVTPPEISDQLRPLLLTIDLVTYHVLQSF